MTAAVLVLAGVILLVGTLLLGSLYLLTQAIGLLRTATVVLAQAVQRSAFLTEEAVKAAREHIATNRALVEAVKNRPQQVTIIAEDPSAMKH